MPVADWVAARNLEGVDGFKCKTCKRTVLYHTIVRNLVRVIEKSKKITETKHIQVAGMAPFQGLLCPALRWHEIRGKTGTKNIIAQRIGVVSSEYIDIKPKVAYV
ncbi:MAG: hypothetical protein GX556_03815 [Fibrobacter sp.]|nr:hypothetical protein [Fibrobacter sp.]